MGDKFGGGGGGTNFGDTFFGTIFWYKIWEQILETNFGNKFWEQILGTNFGNKFWGQISNLKAIRHVQLFMEIMHFKYLGYTKCFFRCERILVLGESNVNSNVPQGGGGGVFPLPVDIKTGKR